MSDMERTSEKTAVDNRWRRSVVTHLEAWCEHTHWLTHRRPWLWLRLPFGIARHCPLADISDRLDQHWQTGVWHVEPADPWPCGAFGPEKRFGAYRCTLPYGHPGDHLAIEDDAVLEAWARISTTTPEDQ